MLFQLRRWRLGSLFWLLPLTPNNFHFPLHNVCVFAIKAIFNAAFSISQRPFDVTVEKRSCLIDSKPLVTGAVLCHSFKDIKTWTFWRLVYIKNIKSSKTNSRTFRWMTFNWNIHNLMRHWDNRGCMVIICSLRMCVVCLQSFWLNNTQAVTKVVFDSFQHRNNKMKIFSICEPFFCTALQPVHHLK